MEKIFWQVAREASMLGTRFVSVRISPPPPDHASGFRGIYLKGTVSIKHYAFKIKK